MDNFFTLRRAFHVAMRERRYADADAILTELGEQHLTPDDILDYKLAEMSGA